MNKAPLHVVLLAAASFAMILSGGCNKQITPVVPGTGNEGYVNFVNAAEALLQQTNGSVWLSDGNMVFINDSVPLYPFLNYPQFSNIIQTTSDVRQFPWNVASNNIYKSYIPDAIVNYSLPYSVTYWLPVASGNYKFIFTSSNKCYLKDTTVTVPPRQLTIYYLVESPDADSTYRIFAIPAVPTGSENKTRVQIANLSPDLASIDIWRTDANGQTVNADLPAGLTFGNHYLCELDTAGSYLSSGNIYLKVKAHGTSQTLLTISLPAIPGSSFLVVVQGFKNQTSRRIRSSNTTYATIPVYPNLRGTLRRVF